MSSIYFSDLVRDELSNDTLVVLKQFEMHSIVSDYGCERSQRYTLDSHKIIVLWCKMNYNGELEATLGAGGKEASIRHVLDTMYHVTGCLDDMYLLLLENRIRYTYTIGTMETSSMWPTSMTDEEILASMSDVIECAAVNDLKYMDNKSGREFKVVDFPMSCYFDPCVCTSRPIYLALLRRKPELLRLLLAHGAEIPIDEDHDCNCKENWLREPGEIAPRHPIMTLLYFCKVIAIKWTEDRFFDQRLRLTRSLHLLLVDVPYHGQLARSICATAGGMCGDYVCLARLTSLKNICRAQIRRSVRCGRDLYPRLFQRLGLPKVLEDYVAIKTEPVF